MFRKQAVEKQKVKLYGNVILRLPRPTKWLFVFLFLVLASIVALLVYGEFARRVSVAGYLLPNQGLLKIQPSRAGFIEQLTISEGQQVKAGQRLFALADQRVLLSGKDLNETLLAQLGSKKQLLQEQITHQRQLHTVTMAELSKQLASSATDKASLEEQKGLLSQQLQLAQEHLHRLEQLSQNNMTPQIKVDEAWARVLQIEQQLSALQLRILQTEAQLQQTQLAQEKSAIQLDNNLAQLQAELITLAQQTTELSGADSIVVKAPMAGTITKITVKANDLVQAVQTVMHLLPHHSSLQAELLVPPEAIGFVQVGQQVQLRLSAFPYQKFGLHTGRIKHIAQTSINNQEVANSPIAYKGNAYMVTVSLDKQTVSAFGQELPLKTGMTLQADIKLAPRALWEWLMEPLISLKGRFA